MCPLAGQSSFQYGYPSEQKQREVEQEQDGEEDDEHEGVYFHRGGPQVHLFHQGAGPLPQLFCDVGMLRKRLAWNSSPRLNTLLRLRLNWKLEKVAIQLLRYALGGCWSELISETPTTNTGIN
jgi:hypothetical protein